MKNAVATLAAVALLVAVPSLVAQNAADHWVGTWSTSEVGRRSHPSRRRQRFHRSCPISVRSWRLPCRRLFPRLVRSSRRSRSSSSPIRHCA